MNSKKSPVFFSLLVGLLLLFTTACGSDDASVDALLSDTADAFYEAHNRLTVTAGTVTVVRSGGGSDEVNGETTIAIGDTVKVSADGSATLYWFDDSVSRLKGGTEMTITAADYNPENLSEVDINFEVVNGEVWSKVINLVDPESEFVGFNGGVVAGVRGTTFDFAVSPEEITIQSVEHTAFLGVREKNGTVVLAKKDVPEGKWGVVKRKKANADSPIVSEPSTDITSEDLEKMEVKDIPQDIKKGEWHQDNGKKDKTDAVVVRARALERLRKNIGALPGDPDYEKKQSAIDKRLEKVVDSAEREDLEYRIARLRAKESAALFLLDQTDRGGRANDLENAIDAAVNQSDDGSEQQGALRQDLGLLLRVLDVAEGPAEDGQNNELQKVRKKLESEKNILEKIKVNPGDEDGKDNDGDDGTEDNKNSDSTVNDPNPKDPTPVRPPNNKENVSPKPPVNVKNNGEKEQPKADDPANGDDTDTVSTDPNPDPKVKEPDKNDQKPPVERPFYCSQPRDKESPEHDPLCGY